MQANVAIVRYLNDVVARRITSMHTTLQLYPNKRHAGITYATKLQVYHHLRRLIDMHAYRAIIMHSPYQHNIAQPTISYYPVMRLRVQKVELEENFRL